MKKHNGTMTEDVLNVDFTDNRLSITRSVWLGYGFTDYSQTETKTCK